MSAAPHDEAAPNASPGTRDAFICHASEDKDEIARPLAHALAARGASVWFDEFELQIGDSLRRRISEALVRARAGVVILSPHFFAKEWPQWELDGLTARELSDEPNIVLPVWHRVGYAEVARYSPPLADRFAARAADGVDVVASQIMQRLRVADAILDVDTGSRGAAAGPRPLIERSDQSPKGATLSVRTGAGACPDCKSPLIRAGMDRVCMQCGWSWSGE